MKRRSRSRAAEVSGGKVLEILQVVDATWMDQRPVEVRDCRLGVGDEPTQLRQQLLKVVAGTGSADHRLGGRDQRVEGARLT